MQTPSFQQYIKVQGGDKGGVDIRQMPSDVPQEFKNGGPIDVPVTPGKIEMPMPNNSVGGMMTSQSVPPMVQDNPFAMDQYKNVGVPDVPISYGGGLADSLLNDNEVPEEIRQKYWYVFHKDNVLTFLDEKRKMSKLLNFDITKIDILNSTPYYDYDFNMELEFGILRNVFETKLDRALGFKGGNIKNERVVLQSQFSESRQINEDGSRNQIKEGFFKRLLGRR